MHENPTAGFGKRGFAGPPQQRRGAFRPTDREPERGGMSPQMPQLILQLGGIAVGIAIAFGILLANKTIMREVGRSMDKAFEERFDAAMRGNDPRDAFHAISDPDPVLTAVHARCDAAYERAKLTKRQEQSVPRSSELWHSETQTAKAAAYVACLTRSTPQRFCDPVHRKHLVAAFERYLAQRQRVADQWKTAAWGVSAVVSRLERNSALMRNIDRRLEMRSIVTSPDVFDGLRDLVATGYVTPGDFGGFAGFGIPDMILRVTDGVEAGKADCR